MPYFDSDDETRFGECYLMDDRGRRVVARSESDDDNDDDDSNFGYTGILFYDDEESDSSSSADVDQYCTIRWEVLLAKVVLGNINNDLSDQEAGEALLKSMEVRAPSNFIIALLEEYPEGAKETTSEGKLLPLHYVWRCWEYSLDVIEALITAYPLGAKTEDKSGLIPLHHALYHQPSDEEAIETILRANLNASRNRDGEGYIPLHYACARGASPDVVRTLISLYKNGTKFDDPNGKLPLHLACEAGADLEVINTLIKSYRKGVAEVDMDDSLPLHYATLKCSETVVDALLKAYPQGALEEDGDEAIPLHSICDNMEKFDVAKVFMKHCPECMLLKTDHFKSPFEMYLKCDEMKESPEDVDFMIKKTYPLNSLSLDALFYDINEIKRRTTKKKSRKRKSSETSIDKSSFSSSTSLHHVVLGGASFEIIKQIVKLVPSSQLSVQDPYGRLPLHCALQRYNGSHDHQKIVNLLIKSYPLGADVADLNGCYPFHYYVCMVLTKTNASPSGSIGIMDHARNLYEMLRMNPAVIDGTKFSEEE